MLMALQQHTAKFSVISLETQKKKKKKAVQWNDLNFYHFLINDAQALNNKNGIFQGINTDNKPF